MIVRLMGEGQYRVGDDVVERLHELDDEAARAVDAGHEESLRRVLDTMASSVRDSGERLQDEDLSASDLIIPPDDLSLEEAKELFSGEVWNVSKSSQTRDSSCGSMGAWKTRGPLSGRSMRSPLRSASAPARSSRKRAEPPPR
ncbi:MAG: hypothetical protein E6G42_09280 [Actinobacteria bacterium]|nr:MAG: hypothetical protein E6G42_09280 [Actinomycetota bacterium]